MHSLRSLHTLPSPVGSSVPTGHPHFGTPFSMLQVADLAHMASAQVWGALPAPLLSPQPAATDRHTQQEDERRESIEHQAGYVITAIGCSLRQATAEALRNIKCPRGIVTNVAGSGDERLRTRLIRRASRPAAERVVSFRGDVGHRHPGRFWAVCFAAMLAACGETSDDGTRPGPAPGPAPGVGTSQAGDAGQQDGARRTLRAVGWPRRAQAAAREARPVRRAWAAGRRGVSWSSGAARAGG